MVRFPDRCAASQGCPISPDRRLVLGRIARWGSAALTGAVTGPLALASGLRAIDVARASFVGLATTSEGILACGERGLIARKDSGESRWQTSRVGSTRSFTALAAHTEGLAVAVGHSGMIAVSRDHGRAWQLVDDAQLKAINPRREAFLTVAIDAERRIFLAGAFGVMARSFDLGQSWQPMKPFGDDFEWHLYGMIHDPVHRNWILAGESGTLAESADGLAWRETTSPYKGSLFGGVVSRMGARIIFGMRGQIFRQSRPGSEWKHLPVPTSVAWMAGRSLSDGRLLLLGDQGTVAVSADDGRSFEVRKLWDGSLADAIEAADGIWIAGVFGLRRFDPTLSTGARG
jgi:photosystem II stability/assembly factor-like uncharacterized protein